MGRNKVFMFKDVPEVVLWPSKRLIFSCTLQSRNPWTANFLEKNLLTKRNEISTVQQKHDNIFTFSYGLKNRMLIATDYWCRTYPVFWDPFSSLLLHSEEGPSWKTPSAKTPQMNVRLITSPD